MNFRFQNNFWSSCNQNQTIDTVIFKNVLKKSTKYFIAMLCPSLFGSSYYKFEVPHTVSVMRALQILLNWTDLVCLNSLHNDSLEQHKS